MIFEIKNIAAFLLILFLSILSERAIPHSHHGDAEAIELDFDCSEKDHEELEERLHSNIYQISELDFNFEVTGFEIIQFIDAFELEHYCEPVTYEYNLIPKIKDSTIEVIIHCASKAPPSLSISLY
jgi:hypothetical protein